VRCSFTFGAANSALGRADLFHLLGCRHVAVASRCDRHGAVCTALADGAIANGGTVFVEPTKLDSYTRRRGDLEILMGVHHWIVDVTIAQPITPFSLSGSAGRSVGPDGLKGLLLTRVHQKRREYAAACAHLSAQFVVGGASTYGGMIPEFVELCGEIASAGTGALVPTELRWSRKRLLDAVAVAVQRGNAAVLQHGLQSVTAERVIARMRVHSSTDVAASFGARWLPLGERDAAAAAAAAADDAFAAGRGGPPRPIGGDVFSHASRARNGMFGQAAADDRVLAAAAVAGGAAPISDGDESDAAPHSPPAALAAARRHAADAVRAANAAAALVAGSPSSAAARGRGRGARGGARVRARGRAGASARGRGRGTAGARGAR
jgi:hypothetical protein